jgi:hypothetical protein
MVSCSCKYRAHKLTQTIVPETMSLEAIRHPTST